MHLETALQDALPDHRQLSFMSCLECPHSKLLSAPTKRASPLLFRPAKLGAPPSKTPPAVPSLGQATLLQDPQVFC
jgi:hypothetical protein